MNFKLGYDAVELLSQAVTVEELDYAISIINNAYGVIRGQIEVLEVLRGGQYKMVEDHDKS